MVENKGLRSIPIFSALIQKGGTGKTTINYTFAEYCAIIQKKRVLIIDLDPQQNIASAYLDMHTAENGSEEPPIHPEFNPNDPEDVEYYNQRSSITDIFEGKLILPYSTYVNEESYGGLIDVIPGAQDKLTAISGLFGSPTFNGELKSLGGNSYVKFAFQLSQLLRSEGITNYYDLVVLDAGPTDNIFFRSIIYSATHIICPYTDDEYSLKGVTTLVSIAKDPKRQSLGFNKLNFLGIMPSQVTGTSVSQRETIEKNIQRFQKVHLPRGIEMWRSDTLTSRKKRESNKKGSIFTEGPAVWRRYKKTMEALYRGVFN